MVDAARIVSAYYRIAALYTLAASVIWGVNTLFLLDAGLSIFEVFIANAAFSAGMVVFEIPTGVVADTKGRRTSFLLSVAVLLVATLGYLLAAEVEAGIVVFVLASVLLGLGFTFYSGAVDAWLVDALRSVQFDGRLDDVFARSQFISGAAMLVGTVGGGVLGGFDLAIPYVVRAALLAALFGVAWRTMHDIGYSPTPAAKGGLSAAMAEQAKAGVAFGWSRTSLRLLMLAGIVQGGFTMWAFYAWQPYFLELLGRDAVWVAGVVSALIALSTMAGNLLVQWFTRYCGRRTTLLLWAAAATTVASIGVGLATDFWLAVALFLGITTAMGLASPVRQAYIHEVVPSDRRATVVSFDSMLSSAGGVGGQVGLGALAQQQSIATGYVTGGIATIVVVPLMWALRRLDEPADAIVGKKAGVDQGCAAHGLPAVASVESTAQPEPAA